ncbi:1,4-dihydroxy-2-naphthoate polyprenyltransferase [uncultured Gulosibacter sp.]|uniref:1,4-dihydroxy-2-naphthoate polyprenyltransferase n=1 Tax=uncultured Gulosibacter sp. TaxID=1339167 RepID=UPI0028896F71|nr:1,4-dihydroxy-2-naphthoate polyprenyltransferase [uncultured Gulosibacter sp.]
MSKRSQQNKHNPTQRKRHVETAADQGPVTIGDWIEGARLRTLPLAAVPVLLGTAAALAAAPGEYHWVRALAALAVALLLQIGVNYANDYSDGIRGTDDYRQGPPRLTGSGRVAPKLVRNVAFGCFAAAGLVGIALCAVTQQWWLLGVGAVCILAAWFYTGGKRPYGYYGLGEVFVFVFFGLVATVGTTYVQILTVPEDTWILAAAAGLFSCAVLMINNVRDIEQDAVAGKRTLAVLIGDIPARITFAVMTVLPFAATVMFGLLYPRVYLSLFSLLILVPAIIIGLTGRTARELVLALKLTSLGSLAWAILMAIGIVVPFMQFAPMPY